MGGEVQDCAYLIKCTTEKCSTECSLYHDLNTPGVCSGKDNCCCQLPFAKRTSYGIESLEDPELNYENGSPSSSSVTLNKFK